MRGPSITQPWEPHSCADWCYCLTYLPARTGGVLLGPWTQGLRLLCFSPDQAPEVLTSPRPRGCWALVHHSARPYTTHTQRHTRSAATLSQPQLMTWPVLPYNLA